MSLMYESQIALLGAVIGVLEKDLARNSNWQALVSLNAALGDVAYQDADQTAARARLEQALELDPVYCARLRLIESIQMIRQAANAAPTDDRSEIGPSQHVAMSVGARSDDDGVQPPCSQSREDDLTSIRGVTPALQDQLRAHGVTRFTHIAEWSSEECKRIAEALGLGRAISQQNWIEQAAVLALKAKKDQPQARAEPQARKGPPSSLVRVAPTTNTDTDFDKTTVQASLSPSAPSPTSPSPPPEQSSQSPPSRPAPSSRRVLVENAAREVVRRLIAQNTNGTRLDAAPVPQVVAATSLPTPVATASGAHRVAFVPQILPDPRRLALIQTVYDSQHEQHDGNGQHHTQEQSNKQYGSNGALLPSMPAEKRASGAAATEHAVSAEPNTQRLKKKKFTRRRRVRRIPKNPAPPLPSHMSGATVAPSERAPVEHVVETQTRTQNNASDMQMDATANAEPGALESNDHVHNADWREGHDVEQKTRQPAALSPPPIPDKARRLALRQRNRRRHLANGVGPDAERFGDGQQWRPGAPEQFGPIDPDDGMDFSGTGTNILAHVEEAHVKIVRSHRENGSEGDPTSAEVRKEDLDIPSAEVGKTSNFGIRFPSKSLFKALKRD